MQAHGGSRHGDSRAGLAADRDRLDQPWTRSLPARLAREAILCGVLDPIIRRYARIKISGRERLQGLEGSVIFAANHSSHVDTPVLQRALPGRFRRRTAFAAASDYFYRRRLKAAMISLLFCTVPLDRRDTKAAATTIDRLRRIVADGWSLVVYPEGTRSRDGRVGVLQPGAAALAMQLELPLVPVFISGGGELMPVGARWPRRHRRAPSPSEEDREQGHEQGQVGDERYLLGSEDRPRIKGHPRVEVGVSFGEPIAVRAGDDRFEVMESVRLFMESCGGETTPDPKRLRRAAARRRSG